MDTKLDTRTHTHTRTHKTCCHYRRLVPCVVPSPREEGNRSGSGHCPVRCSLVQSLPVDLKLVHRCARPPSLELQQRRPSPIPPLSPQTNKRAGTIGHRAGSQCATKGERHKWGMEVDTGWCQAQQRSASLSAPGGNQKSRHVLVLGVRAHFYARVRHSPQAHRPLVSTHIPRRHQNHCTKRTLFNGSRPLYWPMDQANILLAATQMFRQ